MIANTQNNSNQALNAMTSVLQRGGIPQGMTNSNQIVDYLLKNGRISQQQYNAAKAKIQQMAQNGMLPPCPY